MSATKAESPGPELKKALSQRQLRMIAIGGVIGPGLFVGSGVVMSDTGPGVFLTYALSGVLIIMVMRMLFFIGKRFFNNRHDESAEKADLAASQR